MKEHHNVVNIPNARDSIICPASTPEDPNMTVRKNKLLLQCSVIELHNDLCKPMIGLPHVVVKDGKRQVSDTVFRKKSTF